MEPVHQNQTVENKMELSDESEASGIKLQHSHRLFMSPEMSLNAKTFAESVRTLPPSVVAESEDDVLQGTGGSKESKQDRGSINAIRNLTFFGNRPDGGDNKGMISAIKYMTFLGNTGNSDGENKGGINVMRNMTFLRKREGGPPEDVETKGISAVRNMSFLLGKPGEDNKKTYAKRSLSMGYARPSARPSGGGNKIIVGRNLTTRLLPQAEPDEIDQEIHNVLGDNVQRAAQHFLDGDAEEACSSAEAGADDNVIVCGPRLSSIFIGTASLFPLSTIPVSEELQFDLNFDSFLRPEHITDGSNSCIYSARNTGVLAGGPQSVVLKVLNEDLDDVCTAKREFDFERDILAAVR